MNFNRLRSLIGYLGMVMLCCASALGQAVNNATVHGIVKDPMGASVPGAKVRATVAGRTLVRTLSGGGSYLAASDRRVHLGLGEAERVDRLEVTWPSGRVEVWKDIPMGHLQIEEGATRR